MLRYIAYLAALLILSAEIVNAVPVVVYNNGVSNASSGNEMTQWIQAEDFTLGSAATISDVRFWSAESAPGYQGSIAWRIYNQSGGLPGTVLFSGTVAPTRALTGAAYVGLTESVNDFSVGEIPLPAGTYYLGLHTGALSHVTRDEFYWATTNLNATVRGVEDITPFDTGGWVNNTSEHAFQLSLVPEPTSAVALGLFGAATTLRRRR